MSRDVVIGPNLVGKGQARAPASANGTARTGAEASHDDPYRLLRHWQQVALREQIEKERRQAMLWSKPQHWPLGEIAKAMRKLKS